MIQFRNRYYVKVNYFVNFNRHENFYIIGLLYFIK